MAGLTVLDGLLLGLVQGFLEWLPVSSSGQLVVLLMAFLRLPPEHALRLSLFLHLATALSAALYYRRRLIQAAISLLKEGRPDETARLLIYTTVASLATALPVYLLYIRLFREASFDTAMFLVGAALFATALVLWLRPMGGEKLLKDAKKLDYILLGFVQGFAVLPGVSRSAITTALLCVRRFRPEEALRGSFLAAIPVSIIAGLFETPAVSLGAPHLAALATAFIVGVLTIGFTTSLATRLRLAPFLALWALLMIASALPAVLLL